MRDPAASIRCFILIRSRRIASVVVSQYVLLFSCNNVLISVGFTKTPSLFVLLLMVTMPQLQTNHVGLGSPHTHTHTHIPLYPCSRVGPPSHGSCVRCDRACIHVTRHDAGTESLSRQTATGFSFALLLFCIAAISSPPRLRKGERICLATVALSICISVVAATCL